MAKSESSGVTGSTTIIFAIPTDDARVWRFKRGSITFDEGYTVGIIVENGYIPSAKGPRGLTVTYCIITSWKRQGNSKIGDIAMMTCVNGRLLDSVDVARGVDIEFPPGAQEPELSAAAHRDN